MNVSKTLLLLLDLFFLLMILFFVLGLGFYAFTIFKDSTVPFYFVEGDGLSTFSYALLSRLLFAITHYVVFVIIVYFLRKGVKGMVQNKMFNLEVSRYFNLSGILLTAISTISIIFNFSKGLYGGEFKLEFDPFDGQSGLFMIIVGLFLMLMARVIKEGLVLKSENDLTI